MEWKQSREEGDGAKSKPKQARLTFLWALCKRVLWSLFLRTNEYEGFFKKAWIPLFWAALAFGVLASVSSYEDAKDFSAPYPPYLSLQADNGKLSEVKIARQFYFQLMRDDGSTVLFRKDYTLLRVLDTDWFYDKNGNRKPRGAAIRWFKLPSGLGWIAEISLEGKALAGYEQRRKDFLDRSRDTGMLKGAGVSLLFCFWILVLEIREARRQLIKGDN